MSDGALKPEKDFSKEVDAQLPEAEKLAQVGFLDNLPAWDLTDPSSAVESPRRDREALSARETD